MTRPRPHGSVWLYALSWNETRMLPFFFRHYDAWVDRYIIYDDGSTDDTLDQLRAHGRVEVRRFTRAIPDSFVESARIWQNEVWKEARNQARWVVLTAVDEHIHHPDMPSYLRSQAKAGATAMPALGFNMVADTFPPAGTHLATTLRRGMPHVEMNKLSVFDPNGLDETDFAPGRHAAKPTGRVVYPESDELLNLHYKYLDRHYLEARHALLLTGLGTGDLTQNLGFQYQWTKGRMDSHWDSMLRDAIDYREASVGFTTHFDRWWRPARVRGRST